MGLGIEAGLLGLDVALELFNHAHQDLEDFAAGVVVGVGVAVFALVVGVGEGEAEGVDGLANGLKALAAVVLVVLPGLVVEFFEAGGGLAFEAEVEGSV